MANFEELVRLLRSSLKKESEDVIANQESERETAASSLAYI